MIITHSLSATGMIPLHAPPDITEQPWRFVTDNVLRVISGHSGKRYDFRSFVGDSLVHSCDSSHARDRRESIHARITDPHVEVAVAETQTGPGNMKPAWKRLRDAHFCI